jgi:hypothetical protein
MPYYQQSQTHPHLEPAKEKTFRTMGAEDKGLMSILLAESSA